MTHVTCAHGGGRYTVRAIGHAEGSPSVCAAVSAIMFTFAGWARNAHPDSEIVLESGNASVTVHGECGDVYDAVCIGFIQLAKSFPEQVKIDFE